MSNYAQEVDDDCGLSDRHGVKQPRVREARCVLAIGPIGDNADDCFDTTDVDARTSATATRQASGSPG
jgi:hypothetical protein